jgi:23S rRNA pseudouridine1911/1915/1917 synthase
VERRVSEAHRGLRGAVSAPPVGERTAQGRQDRWVVTALEAGIRLDRFLADAGRLGSRGRAVWALERRKVLLNEADTSPAEAGRRLVAGDTVRVWMDRPGSARERARRPDTDGADLQIVFEDAALLVVNKPAGLLTVPLPRREEAESVESQLAAHLRSKGKRRPLVVHRIDRDTSGLVVFATHGDAQQRLKDQFRRREPERVYLAVVYGTPEPSEGVWSDYLVWDDTSLIQRATRAGDPRGKLSTSEYRVLERFAETSLLEVHLVTGKRNQIRLQARLRGHTLVGEQRYTYGPDELRPVDFPRQALHAHRLGFDHPISGKRMRFEAPLPPDMEELLVQLSKPSLQRKSGRSPKIR